MGGKLTLGNLNKSLGTPPFHMVLSFTVAGNVYCCLCSGLDH